MKNLTCPIQNQFNLRTLFLVQAFLVSVFISGPARAEQNDEAIKNGRAAYLQHCARCHGDEGKGDGMDAKRLSVVPRNLTEGVIKFKSTVSGTPPSDRDFMWILNHGMSGAGMPSFANLSADVKADIIAYIKTLSPEYTRGTPEPLPVPHKKAKIDLKVGREVYDKLQCAVCHGPQGHANGSSASTLVDSWKNPLPPANLAKGWTYRSGNTAEEVYYRLQAGINGAPMPSYQGAVSDEEAWQLANYIASIQQKPNWALHIKLHQSKDVVSKVSDPMWTSVQKTDIPLSSWKYSKGKREKVSITSVSVKATTDGKSVSYLISWFDPTKDDKSNSDILVLALKPKALQLGLDNLYTLYTPDAAKMPMLLWKAQNPETIVESLSNLDSVTKSSLNGATQYPVDAIFEDGLWSVVFTRPLNHEDSIDSLGVAIWDGSTNQSKHSQSVSKWISLTTGDSTHH